MKHQHLKYIYELIVYRTIEKKRKSFLDYRARFNMAVAEDWQYGFLDKWELDTLNETLILYYKPHHPNYANEPLMLTFKDWITRDINKDKVILRKDIEKLSWELNQLEFIAFLDKIKNEIRYINIHLEQYEDAKKLIFIEKTLTEISDYIDTKFGKSYEYLQNKPILKIKQEKKLWLKLVAEAKIKELVDELVEFGIENEENDFILISNRWYALQRDFQNGIIKRDDYDLENNKVTKSLINFVRDLK